MLYLSYIHAHLKNNHYYVFEIVANNAPDDQTNLELEQVCLHWSIKNFLRKNHSLCIHSPLKTTALWV
jgi:hypothetical protein